MDLGQRGCLAPPICSRFAYCNALLGASEKDSDDDSDDSDDDDNGDDLYSTNSLLRTWQDRSLIRDAYNFKIGQRETTEERKQTGDKGRRAGMNTSEPLSHQFQNAKGLSEKVRWDLKEDMGAFRTYWRRQFQSPDVGDSQGQGCRLFSPLKEPNIFEE